MKRITTEAFGEKYVDRFLNSLNIENVKKILKLRNVKFPIEKLENYYNAYKSGNTNISSEFQDLLEKIPNKVSEFSPVGSESKNEVLKLVGTFENKGFTCEDLGLKFTNLKMNDVRMGSESRAYYFIGELAKLHRALIRFSLAKLMKYNWKFVSVDDFFTDDLMEKCGFMIDRTKNQLFNLLRSEDEIRGLFYPNEYTKSILNQPCLSGTSEMLLVAYLSGNVLKKRELPLRLCSFSRCYRREVTKREGHLYRVHQFDKVEMFGATHPEDGEKLFDEILSIQEEIFSEIGLNYRTINIASEDLGDSAYKKIDVEAWMPGEGSFGEISSASYCTDYQAKRFDIRLNDADGEFVHTLNGTACAIPRMMKAIVETNQTEIKHHIYVPEVLQPFMNGKRKFLKHQIPSVGLNWISKITDPNLTNEMIGK